MENLEKIHDMERHDTRHKLPAGWLLLFIGLIVWGIYYCVAYTPATTGWSQALEYEKSLKK